MNNWKKQLLKRTTCLATACCLLTGAAGATTFTDVPSSHWAKSYIEAASDKGYVSGVGSGKFNPEGSISGVEFISMIIRAFYPDALEGREVQKVWYDPYLYTACEVNVLSYSKLGFDPYVWSTVGTQPLTRYEMAILAYNGLRERGILRLLDTDACVRQAQAHFTDWNSIPDHPEHTDCYRNAIAFCYVTGVLSDTGNGAFEGNKTVSRAQACSILIRMDEAIQEAFKDANGAAGLNPDRTDGATTEAEVQEKLRLLQQSFPDCYHWEKSEIYGNNSSYSVPALNLNVTDGGAWIWYASDFIFGDAPIQTHHNWDDIQVGDVIKMDYPTREADHAAHYTWGLVTECGSTATKEYITVTRSDKLHMISWGERVWKWERDLAPSEDSFTVYSRM